MFHIISRAVDERKIFEDEDDRLRFIFQVYTANIGRPAYSLHRKDVNRVAKDLLQGIEPPTGFVIKEHDPLVHLLDFSLVMTHYHFYLVPVSENSTSTFLRKLNNGFAKYFNLKHGRKGVLFGSRYQSIPVKTDFQAEAVSRYVSIVNPLDIFQPGWRENGLKDPDRALEFLKKYQFSSFPDKIKERNSSILAPKEIREQYGIEFISREDCLAFVKDFLKSA
ncbi:MAG: hypothetical protein Q8O30_07710 [Candidatus Omnitrophota bacterium]|nr:hypothetical protein [Candidatus Omnitrophota bacterium]